MRFSFAVPAMAQKKYCRYLANRNAGNTLDCSFVMAGIESPLDISLIDAAWRLNWSPSMEINPLATLDAVQPTDLDSGPVVVLNLLKFKPGNSLDTYLEYIRRVTAECADSGIELIYAGRLKERIQGEIGEWDVVLVVRYPSRRHCYEMFRSTKYQAHNHLAEASLEKRVLWPSEPLLPYKTKTVEFEGGEWLALLAR